MIAVDVPDDASDQDYIAAYEAIGIDADYALAVAAARRSGVPIGD